MSYATCDWSGVPRRGSLAGSDIRVSQAPSVLVGTGLSPAFTIYARTYRQECALKVFPSGLSLYRPSAREARPSSSHRTHCSHPQHALTRYRRRRRHHNRLRHPPCRAQILRAHLYRPILPRLSHDSFGLYSAGGFDASARGAAHAQNSQVEGLSGGALQGGETSGQAQRPSVRRHRSRRASQERTSGSRLGPERGARIREDVRVHERPEYRCRPVPRTYCKNISHAHLTNGL